MEVIDLRRGMRFGSPNENVSVRNRDNFKWTEPDIVITNIRRHSEDPNLNMIYYKDTGGNRYKTTACDFLSRYGEFYKESKIANAEPQFLTAEELEEYALIKEELEGPFEDKKELEMKNKKIAMTDKQISEIEDAKDIIESEGIGKLVQLTEPDNTTDVVATFAMYLLGESGMKKGEELVHIAFHEDGTSDYNISLDKYFLEEEKFGSKMKNKKAQLNPEEYFIKLPNTSGESNIFDLYKLCAEYYSGQGDPVYAAMSRRFLPALSVEEFQAIERMIEEISDGKYYDADMLEERGFVENEMEDMLNAYYWLPTLKQIWNEIPDEKKYMDEESCVTRKAPDMFSNKSKKAQQESIVKKIHEMEKQFGFKPLNLGPLDWDEIWNYYEYLNKLENTGFGRQPGEALSPLDDKIEEEALLQYQVPITNKSKKAQNDIPFGQSDIDALFGDELQFEQFDQGLSQLNEQEILRLEELQKKQEMGQISPEEVKELDVLLDKLESAVTKMSKKAQTKVKLKHDVKTGMWTGREKETQSGRLLYQIKWDDPHQPNQKFPIHDWVPVDQLDFLQSADKMSKKATNFPLDTVVQLAQEIENIMGTTTVDAIIRSQNTKAIADILARAKIMSDTILANTERLEAPVATKKKAAYDLSFSPEFFTGMADEEPRSDGKPTNVLDAITYMKQTEPELWEDMKREIFRLGPDQFLDEETVLDKVIETNTCGTLTPPVDVWIDEEGFYTVDVYEPEDVEQTLTVTKE